MKVTHVNMADGTEYSMDASQPEFKTEIELRCWADTYYKGWSSILLVALPEDEHAKTER